MRYDTLLFDMDGTVMKTERGVIGGFRYALRELGRPFPPVPERLFMGPPLTFSFREYCDIPEELIDEAVRQYRVYYNAGGIMECEVYPGVGELLEKLTDRGVKCLIASSKPEIYVNRILEKFGIDRYFAFASGSDIGGKWGTKEEVITRALDMAGVTDASRCLMVGDRLYDVKGAAAFGMDSCGVTWGYGTREELFEAGATYVVDRAEEVPALIWS